MSLFEVQDLHVEYGGVEALKGISLEIADGERCIALVGPNGAGKSTFVNAMTGLLKWEGSALFKGAPIAGSPTEDWCRWASCSARRGATSSTT